jgi:hypothetical protein
MDKGRSAPTALQAGEPLLVIMPAAVGRVPAVTGKKPPTRDEAYRRPAP